jgi:hypothetical protein
MGWTELIELLVKAVVFAAIGTGAIWLGAHALAWL